MKHKEIMVAGADELKDGEMKQVDAGGTKILLARVNGKYHAVGAICPHYGGPLAEGALCGERVICPWHHASFDVKTGDLLEPPAFDALPRYEVKIEGDSVIVVVPDEAGDRRTPPMASPDARQDERSLVIWAGARAANRAAQTWGGEAFRGRVR